jgi:hypothetical protein
VTKTKSPGCDHCSHPLFAGIKCDICGWKAETMHTCSYECTRPACVLAQRNELRAKLEDSQDAANKFAYVQQVDEALMRQVLEALEYYERRNPEWGYADERTIAALRQRLEEK